jgi:hypothetical protein
VDKIHLSQVSAKIDNPNSVLKRVKYIREASSTARKFGINTEEIHERTFYRDLELLGKHAGEIYPRLMDKVHAKFGLDWNYVFMDWSSRALAQ